MNASERTLLKAEVPIEEMPTGILQFSLFTSDWIPVAERIVFINNRLHEFNAKLTTPLVSLDKRGKMFSRSLFPIRLLPICPFL
jgi:hypothetical protein